MAEGARYFLGEDNPVLVENLYLSAFSRKPTDKEREVALAFLKRGTNRLATVTDLVWTLVNTQEFLFQK